MKNITSQIKAGVRARNMQSDNGNDIANQMIIETKFGTMFRSYNSNIAFIPNDEGIVYLGEDWDYSRTTMKYLGKFLGTNAAGVRDMLKSGNAVLKPEL